MGHFVTAIIAGVVVADHILKSSSFVAANMRDDFLIIPLEDDDLDAIGFPLTEVDDGFTYLSPELSRFLCAHSLHGPLVYLETDYFGGVGTQAARSFVRGSPIDATLSVGDGSINRALRTIGVIAPAGIDEFDFIGLSLHRFTSDWKEVAHNSNT